MPYLAGMARLSELHLAETRVTDQSLEHLAGLLDLRILSLGSGEPGSRGWDTWHP